VIRRNQDKKRLAWIHTFPCIVPECHARDVEADHVGARGFGTKCGDDETLPICSAHHRTGRDARHVLGRNFWRHHGLDRDSLLAEYHERYRAFLNGEESYKETSGWQYEEIGSDPF
jgi:hypothetical protein